MIWSFIISIWNIWLEMWGWLNANAAAVQAVGSVLAVFFATFVAWWQYKNTIKLCEKEFHDKSIALSNMLIMHINVAKSIFDALRAEDIRHCQFVELIDDKVKEMFAFREMTASILASTTHKEVAFMGVLHTRIGDVIKTCTWAAVSIKTNPKTLESLKKHATEVIETLCELVNRINESTCGHSIKAGGSPPNQKSK